MTTHKTLAAARAAKTEKVQSIAEIEHATEGRCFIGLTTAHDYFASEVKRRPAEFAKIGVVKFYAGHDRLTPEEITERDTKIKAEVQHDLKHKCRCDRCGVKIDGTLSYSQDEWSWLGKSKVRVKAFYCDVCSRTLKAVGAGEYSAMQERAASVPSYEPEGYEDF